MTGRRVQPALAPKVSVVVPVYNPGPELERCIASVLAQSLPPDEFEAVFVDDGSTDESPARLDEVAAAHPNVRVIHQENSGWPGKPRNVGLEASRGEYVFFMDHDDRLGPEALERLYAMAVRNWSDVVVAKIVGFGRHAPRGVFRRNRDRVTFASAPELVNTLTPQKLYRRAFLDAHGIRYPEGRRRLEDHVFVLRSYFAASVISVLGDYAAYFHHAVPGGSAASGRFDPAGSFDPAFYFPFLREVLEIVEANTVPGPFRDRLLRRYAEGELLGRLGGGAFGRRFLDFDDDYRRRLVVEVRALVVAKIPATVDPLLPPQQRTQLAVLRTDRPDVVELLLELARAEHGVVPVAHVRSIGPGPGGALRVVAEAELTGDGTPLVYERRGGRLLLPVPATVAAVVPDASRQISHGRSILRRGGSDANPSPALAILRRDDAVEVVLRPTVRQRLHEVPGGVRLTRMVTFTVDPDRITQGSKFAPGRYSVRIRPGLAGYSRDARLTRALAGDLPVLDQPPGSGGTPLTAGWAGPDNQLVIDAHRPATRGTAPRLRRRIRRLLSR